VGYNSTGCTIENCYATGEVTGDSYTGGLVGCKITNGSITKLLRNWKCKRQQRYTGGLVGYNYGTITDCYALVK
jgi:hypothetical protein